MNRILWKISLLLVASLFCCTIASCSDDESVSTTETDPDSDDNPDSTEPTPEEIGTIFTVDSISYKVTSSTDDDITCEVTSSSPKYSGDIEIPSSVEYDDITYAVTAIGYLAFYCCDNLTSVTIPNSVTAIGNYAFAWCRTLTGVTFGSAVTDIGNYAFYECCDLTSVTIPNTVTTIGSSAYRYCNKLTVLTLGNSVTTIGDYAFSSCNNVIEICSQNPTPPTIESTTFDGVDKTACGLYVPTGCMEAYSTADNWDEFSNIDEKEF